MKKIYFLLLSILTFAFASAQIINFPDANFKAKLLQANPSNYIASTTNTLGNPTYPYVSIDTNGDGEIQVSEASAIQYLDISYSQIVNLEGINSFVNLKLLDCKYNQIGALDVTGLTNLEYLYCPNNQISNLNVNGLLFLKNLNCYYNHLTNLDLSSLTSLRYLFCYANQLTNLNVLGLTNLYYVYCYENQFSSLNFNGLTNLRFLRCYSNQLVTLYIKNGNLSWSDLTFNDNPNLNYICTDVEDINYVQQKNNDYGYTNCTVDSNCSLTNNLFEISSDFILYPIPAKDILTVSNKQNAAISTISIYNILGQLVLTATNPNKIIDVSSLKTGDYFIKILSNKGVSSTKFIKE